MREDAPLIVTLTMDEAAAAHFNALRREHFPSARNYLDAHITLFHALPPEHEPAIRRTLADQAGAREQFAMRSAGIAMLGFGNAIVFEAQEALELRAALAHSFLPWLSKQDRDKRFSPHVTVQNKVDAKTAKALHAQLQRDFVPRDVTATGLALWRYRGGPWQAVETYRFA